MKEMITMFMNEVDAQYHPGYLTELVQKFKGDYQKVTDYIFNKTVFADAAKYQAMLAKPNLKQIQKDPALLLYNSVVQQHTKLQRILGSSADKLEKGRRLLMAATMEFKPEMTGYPDANSTPRFTYGYVGDYQPADAVHFNYFTTIDGIFQKEDPANDEFIVSERLRELYLSKDYGRYATSGGTLAICFTTNNDITGGNSGSPVLNGKGELIGTAFDGNWEAMSGDIAFEPDLQKCINVDIRYVLWVIDKFAGAGHLVNEMTIVQEGN
jgi:hypothetical protein